MLCFIYFTLFVCSSYFIYWCLPQFVSLIKSKIMSVIKMPLLFAGSKSEKHLYTLFDSGANLSCIHPDHANILGTPESLPRVRKLSTASESHFIRHITEKWLVKFFGILTEQGFVRSLVKLVSLNFFCL